MASDKPNRVKQILELALSAPRAERARHVADACADDLELRREVESLLLLYEEGSPRPDDPSPLSSPTTFSPLDDSPADRDAARRPFRAGAGSPDVATSWGGFVLLEELGRGGFGVVYRAWDAALKRDVALKIIDARRLPHATEDAVLREGQMMARVRHPNVVTVFSAQRIGSEIGLAMDYIKGRTLATLVAEDGSLSAHEAALIGVSLCDALSAVHRLGLVHRDLKASNVMRETGGRIVLMDFGAGREIGIDAESRFEILGTPVYMPPEVLLGSRGTPVSDIYSLGVLLYNLVTGAYPVRGVRADELRMAHLGGERVSLAERRPELPSRFVDAVEKALSPDPKDRFQSAVAFKRQLSEAMPHLPPDSGGRRRRPARRDGKPPSERLTPTPVPVPSGGGLLQRFVVGLGSAIAVCWVLGFLTTMEFNAVLGRTGAFAAEGVLAYPVWGARALIAPIVWMAIMLLLIISLGFIGRVAGQIAPPIRRARSAAGDFVSAQARRWSLDTPNALAQALLVGGIVALIVVTISFRNLIGTFLLPVQEQSPSDLAVLRTSNENLQVAYRRSLELIILLLGTGLMRVRRSAAAKPETVTLAGVAAVMLVALVLLTLPWRLIFQADFEEATLAGRRCFVLGEAPEEILLHCPGLSPRRNVNVAKSDGRLARTGQISNLFDGYAAQRVTE